MAQIGLHTLEVPARGDQQRRARVAKVVEADTEQLRRLDRRRVVTVPEVVMMDWATLGSCKHPSVGRWVAADVLAEHLRQEARDRDRPLLAGLGGPAVEAACFAH